MNVLGSRMTPGRRVPALPQRVVGIGASAGGLDALKQRFARLPTDTGLAFVVLQHLPPSQVGKLAQILAKVTAMPVIDVETGQRVAADHVYVVPPRIAAGLFRGALVMRTPKGGARPPIERSATVRLRQELTATHEYLHQPRDHPRSAADRSLTRSQSGLGIGLALVRQLVERQGGTIEVDGGGDGRGATFIVRIPVFESVS